MKQLSPRELSVIVGLSNGLDQTEIARRLQCSGRTVARAMVSAAGKLQARTKFDLISRAIELDVLPPGLILAQNGLVVRTVRSAARRSVGLEG